MIVSTQGVILTRIKQTFKLAYHASKMANYASEPRHQSTSSLWNYADGKTPSELKISSWNVNGFRSVIRKGLLQSYLLQHDPDMLCIN